LRPERVRDADKNAPSVALMNRPRGYLDPTRDKMAFDRQTRRRPVRYSGPVPRSQA
jgi:triacylglycerol lipase